MYSTALSNAALHSTKPAFFGGGGGFNVLQSMGEGIRKKYSCNVGAEMKSRLRLRSRLRGRAGLGRLGVYRQRERQRKSRLL